MTKNRIKIQFTCSSEERDWMQKVAEADDENVSSAISVYFRIRSKELGIPLPDNMVPLYKRRRHWRKTGYPHPKAQYIGKLNEVLGLHD